MAPANNDNQNHHANNQSRTSLPSQSANLANHIPIPNPNPTAGHGPDAKNPNPYPSHFNRNNSSLRLFCDWLDKAEKDNHEASFSSAATMAIEGSEEDSVLSKSEFLTREEVLRRRSRRVKQLAKVYRDYYWAMTEELKLKYKEYYLEYGKSPFQEDEDARGECKSTVTGATMEENTNGKLGLGLNVNRCEIHGCKMKAMAMTRFCHSHILSDAKQKLYKGCTYVTKSSPMGPTYCMKPVLRSTVPLLCSQHLKKAEKHVSKALKKAGLTATSKSKVAPKFHVVVAEFVRQIQTKRRVSQKALVEAVESKEDKSS